ncbi:MAG: hypothetical protein RSB02_06140 [Anaerovoracaceae bacterium]
MITETIELINSLLQRQLEPMLALDIFVGYISPILQLLVILGGAGAGLYKYYKIKNREVYEKLLSEVYAPLYQYLVKQELCRSLLDLPQEYKESPILEITSRKIKTTISATGLHEESAPAVPVLDLDRKGLISILDNVNMGLASKELYTLLSMYKVLVYYESQLDKTAHRVLTASIMKVEVENKLRKEIISGYSKYHKKLGIQTGGDSDFFTLSEDQINFNISVSEEEKRKLKTDIESNPTKY